MEGHVEDSRGVTPASQPPAPFLDLSRSGAWYTGREALCRVDTHLGLLLACKVTACFPNGSLSVWSHQQCEELLCSTVSPVFDIVRLFTSLVLVKRCLMVVFIRVSLITDKAEPVYFLLSACSSFLLMFLLGAWSFLTDFRSSLYVYSRQ